MNNPLHIIAGESIPYVKEAFDSLGRLTFLPGRRITTSEVKEANILLIRSITKINKDLLHGSAVEFVGSASAGIDHIDSSYLNTQNIAYASAPGSNANSVAEYVITALLTLATRQGCLLSGKTIGIIGVGHIGKLVKKKAEALGMLPILHDPPLADAGLINRTTLQDALECDIVTLHTPLTTSGPYPTHHLINGQTISYLKPSTIFINAARGGIVDSAPLLQAITHHRIGPVVLDVWEHEPHINWDLFNAVTIGTPHIAGHSLDGKANGTNMIYTALCQYLGVHPTWRPEHSLPPPQIPSISLDGRSDSKEKALHDIVTQIYDLEGDCRRMQDLTDVGEADRPARFDGLRKNYPIRREFHQTRVNLPPWWNALRLPLEGLGISSIQEAPRGQG